MLPYRPRALDADFAPEFAMNFAEGETACDPKPAHHLQAHHSQICPVCSQHLTGHRCKLVCTQCGYYLSCADYY